MGVVEVKTATEQKSLLATLTPGKRTRLRRLLFEFGPGHGTLLFLPIDQGIEHGPRDFFPNPASKDPEYQFSLAAEAGYSALACQIGLATRYYPARMAMEMGADVVKLNFPKSDPEKDKDQPAPYNEMDVTPEEAVRQIVESAGRSLVVLSGGSKTDDETVLNHTKTIMEAGGSGVIFGRNVWQREKSQALEIIGQIKETLLSNV